MNMHSRELFRLMNSRTIRTNNSCQCMVWYGMV